MSNTTTRLINALKTITSESQDIKFDKTVQGKIVAIVNEEQYRVSINNATVLAYVTDGSTYKEGDSVYILIPEGDPSNIKTITGKVPLTSSAIVVTDPMEGISKVGMPFEDLYGLTGRRVSIIPDQSGVRKDVNIVNYDYPSRYEEIVETSKKYSHMMLTADFYNFFSDAASISKGSFGMHLTFSCLYENNYTTLEIELDSADMLGDIYFLAAPVTMYKFFSIPYGYIVTGLEQVSIYQGGNFNGNINEATDWIIGGNIHLSFIDGENIRNNEIKFSLTTEDNGTYFSDEVDTLWLYGSTDKVISGETYFWFQQDDSVNSMSDSGYNQYGGIGWRLLDTTTENKYAISNYDGFIQSNYKAVIVINTGQFYVSNIITLNQSGINIPQLKYHIEEDIIKFDLDFNKNEYEIYWRKENAMHNPIYDWAGEEDNYDAIESRAWYYVTVLKYGTGEIVYNAAKTIVSSAENGTIINNFSGALLHHYDANGDLSQDAQDSIYSLTAEMGDSVGGRWDLPADVVFPYQSDDSLLVIQSVSANTIYYKLAPKYDANKMNNRLAYLIGDERYSQYITVLKDGDNGTNGTRYSAKIVRTPRSSRYLYHNGYDWINNEYEVQVLVYKDGVSVEDFKVKQWLIPKTRAVINSVLKLQNDALTCKIRFETDAEAIGLLWNKATVIGEVESSNDSLIYQWTVDGQIYSNTSTCKFDIEKDFEGQLQCVILDNYGDKVGEFNQNINAEAVDNSHTSLTNSAIGYYTKRINTDEDNHILSIGVEGTRDDIVNYYQNVVEAEIEVDGYSIFAYHAVPVCYGVNQVEVEEINSNVIYKSDGMNPQFTPFAIVSNITNPEITALGQASIVGGKYTPASKFLYDEGMPAIRVTDVDSDSFCIVPIVTILNNYGLSYLNSWDGTSIEINEDGGYILAPQIGAGVKEEDNSFSGVLMGQLEGVSSNAGLVGLYGFDHGSASYGFLQDGTAFIGKSGLGQIKFDGNESTIMSANYEVNKKGMKLDLLNGTIDASGFNIDKEGNASFNGNVVAVSGQFGPLVLEDGKIVYRSTDPIEGLSIDAEYSCNNISNYKYNENIQRPISIEALIASNYYMKYTNQGDWVLAKNYGTWLRDNEIDIDDEENLHIGERQEKTNIELHDELKDENWSKSPNEPTATNNYLWQRIDGSEDETPYTYLLIRKYQTVDDVFNELTNQGRAQGFFFGADGKLYVNANYIKTGTLDADLIAAGTITANKVNLKGLEIKNNNNVTTFQIDQNGNVTTNGAINATSLSIGGSNIINQQGGLALPAYSTIPGYAQTSDIPDVSNFVENDDILDATQIIYYRSDDDLSFPIAPEDNEHNPEWLEEQDSTISKYGAWSKKIAEPTGSYIYLYSCVQTKMFDGTVSNSQVRQDDGSGGGKAREQYIYYLSATNTSPTVPTTWCTNTADEAANWTTSPPTYRRDYPYKYVAIQTQSVAQQNYGGVCCNTSAALLDNTTTVIDGGHISTGTIQSNSNETNFWDLGNGLLSIGESDHTWLEHDDLPVPPTTVNGVGFQYISNTKQWAFSGTATTDITVNLYHLDQNLLSVPEHHCFSFETSEGLLDTNSGIQVWFNDTNITNKQYDIIDGVLDHIKLSINSGTIIPQGSYIKVNYHTGVINGNVIKANTINADKVNLKGLEIYDNNNIKTLEIDQNGNVNIKGKFESEYEGTEDFYKYTLLNNPSTIQELRNYYDYTNYYVKINNGDYTSIFEYSPLFLWYLYDEDYLSTVRFYLREKDTSQTSKNFIGKIILDQGNIEIQRKYLTELNYTSIFAIDPIENNKLLSINFKEHGEIIGQDQETNGLKSSFKIIGYDDLKIQGHQNIEIITQYGNDSDIDIKSQNNINLQTYQGNVNIQAGYTSSQKINYQVIGTENTQSGFGYFANWKNFCMKTYEQNSFKTFIMDFPIEYGTCVFSSHQGTTTVNTAKWHVVRWASGRVEYYGKFVYNVPTINDPAGSSGLYSSNASGFNPLILPDFRPYIFSNQSIDTLPTVKIDIINNDGIWIQPKHNITNITTTNNGAELHWRPPKIKLLSHWSIGTTKKICIDVYVTGHYFSNADLISGTDVQYTYTLDSY